MGVKPCQSEGGVDSDISNHPMSTANTGQGATVDCIHPLAQHLHSQPQSDTDYLQQFTFELETLEESCRS